MNYVKFLTCSRDILHDMSIAHVVIGSEQRFLQKHWVYKWSCIERLYSRRVGKLYCLVNICLFIKQIRRLF